MLYDTRVTHACTRTHKGKGYMEGMCCMICESHMYVYLHIKVNSTRVTHACTRTHKGKGYMEGVCCMIRESHMYVHVHIRVRGTWRVCVV